MPAARNIDDLFAVLNKLRRFAVAFRVGVFRDNCRVLIAHLAAAVVVKSAEQSRFKIAVGALTHIKFVGVFPADLYVVSSRKTECGEIRNGGVFSRSLVKKRFGKLPREHSFLSGTIDNAEIFCLGDARDDRRFRTVKLITELVDKKLSFHIAFTAYRNDKVYFFLT